LEVTPSDVSDIKEKPQCLRKILLDALMDRAAAMSSPGSVIAAKRALQPAAA
jgi:hypothetical protein